jgi:uncharacterized protein
MSLRFDWDLKKARKNLAKHGVSFEEAESVFADPLAWIYPDPLHSEEEHREILIGQSTAGRLLLVCFAELEDTVRMISTREPTTNERHKYEEESRNR